MTLDLTSMRSLRTLAEQRIERSGEYVQVSIFAKTILELVDEVESKREQLATLKARESAEDAWKRGQKSLHEASSVVSVQYRPAYRCIPTSTPYIAPTAEEESKP